MHVCAVCAPRFFLQNVSRPLFIGACSKGVQLHQQEDRRLCRPTQTFNVNSHIEQRPQYMVCFRFRRDRAGCRPTPIVLNLSDNQCFVYKWIYARYFKFKLFIRTVVLLWWCSFNMSMDGAPVKSPPRTITLHSLGANA